MTPLSRSTYFHRKPSASLCRSPSASAIDQRVLWRRLAVALRNARASAPVRVSCSGSSDCGASIIVHGFRPIIAGLVGGGVGEEGVSGGVPSGSRVGQPGQDDGCPGAYGVFLVKWLVVGSGVLASPVGDAGPGLLT